jgi:hypothetical protein
LGKSWSVGGGGGRGRGQVNVKEMERKSGSSSRSPSLSRRPSLKDKKPSTVVISKSKKKAVTGAKKERWLLTRKTWRYMTDAVGNLLPEYRGGSRRGSAFPSGSAATGTTTPVLSSSPPIELLSLPGPSKGSTGIPSPPGPLRSPHERSTTSPPGQFASAQQYPSTSGFTQKQQQPGGGSHKTAISPTSSAFPWGSFPSHRPGVTPTGPGPGGAQGGPGGSVSFQQVQLRNPRHPAHPIHPDDYPSIEKHFDDVCTKEKKFLLWTRTKPKGISGPALRELKLKQKEEAELAAATGQRHRSGDGGDTVGRQGSVKSTMSLKEGSSKGFFQHHQLFQRNASLDPSSSKDPSLFSPDYYSPEEEFGDEDDYDEYDNEEEQITVRERRKSSTASSTMSILGGPGMSFFRPLSTVSMSSGASDTSYAMITLGSGQHKILRNTGIQTDPFPEELIIRLRLQAVHEERQKQIQLQLQQHLASTQQQLLGNPLSTFSQQFSSGVAGGAEGNIETGVGAANFGSGSSVGGGSSAGSGSGPLSPKMKGKETVIPINTTETLASSKAIASESVRDSEERYLEKDGTMIDAKINLQSTKGASSSSYGTTSSGISTGAASSVMSTGTVSSVQSTGAASASSVLSTETASSVVSSVQEASSSATGTTVTTSGVTSSSDGTDKKSEESGYSSSISDTVMRYLRMVRKNSKADNKETIDKFKTVNYDRSLRYIKSKNVTVEEALEHEKNKALGLGQPGTTGTSDLPTLPDLPSSPKSSANTGVTTSGQLAGQLNVDVTKSVSARGVGSTGSPVASHSAVQNVLSTSPSHPASPTNSTAPSTALTSPSSIPTTEVGQHNAAAVPSTTTGTSAPTKKEKRKKEVGTEVVSTPQSSVGTVTLRKGKKVASQGVPSQASIPSSPTNELSPPSSPPPHQQQQQVALQPPKEVGIQAGESLIKLLKNFNPRKFSEVSSYGSSESPGEFTSPRYSIGTTVLSSASGEGGHEMTYIQQHQAAIASMMASMGVGGFQFPPGSDGTATTGAGSIGGGSGMGSGVHTTARSSFDMFSAEDGSEFDDVFNNYQAMYQQTAQFTQQQLQLQLQQQVLQQLHSQQQQQQQQDNVLYSSGTAGASGSMSSTTTSSASTTRIRKSSNSQGVGGAADPGLSLPGTTTYSFSQQILSQIPLSSSAGTSYSRHHHHQPQHQPHHQSHLGLNAPSSSSHLHYHHQPHHHPHHNPISSSAPGVTTTPKISASSTPSTPVGTSGGTGVGSASSSSVGSAGSSLMKSFFSSSPFSSSFGLGSKVGFGFKKPTSTTSLVTPRVSSPIKTNPLTLGSSLPPTTSSSPNLLSLLQSGSSVGGVGSGGGGTTSRTSSSSGAVARDSIPCSGGGDVIARSSGGDGGGGGGNRSSGVSFKGSLVPHKGLMSLPVGDESPSSFLSHSGSSTYASGSSTGGNGLLLPADHAESCSNLVIINEISVCICLQSCKSPSHRPAFYLYMAPLQLVEGNSSSREALLPRIPHPLLGWALVGAALPPLAD